jgi:polysaccharide biosynthesis protein PelD
MKMMKSYKDILIKTAEFLVLFALLIWFDHAQLNGTAFSGINPNPYWLPVIIFAVAYGTGMGLAAAIAASVIWILAPHPLPIGTDQLERQFHVSMLPLLWASAAVIIGEVTAARKAKIAKFDLRYRQLADDWEKTANAFARLNKINRDLQIRIATEPHVASEALCAAKGLISSHHESQKQAVIKLASLATQTQDFTYYRAHGNQLFAQLRGDAAQGRPVDVSSDKWAQELIQDPAILHRGRERDRNLLGGLGIVAVPVCNPESGAFAAVLVIHQANKLRLTAAKLSELSHVAQTIEGFSSMLARPHLVKAADFDGAEGRVA